MRINQISIISQFFFPANIKSINPVQKYPHIIESNACVLKIFVIMFLFGKAGDKGRLINSLISLAIFSTPKESKQVTLLLFIHKVIQ